MYDPVRLQICILRILSLLLFYGRIPVISSFFVFFLPPTLIYICSGLAFGLAKNSEVPDRSFGVREFFFQFQDVSPLYTFVGEEKTKQTKKTGIP